MTIENILREFSALLIDSITKKESTNITLYVNIHEGGIRSAKTSVEKPIK